MSTRIAAFNVENLFDRAKAFNAPPHVSAQVQADLGALNALFEKDIYSAQDKQEMVRLINDLGMSKSDTGPFVILRQIRERVVRRPRNNGPMEIIQNGRDDWVGWCELKTESVNEIAIENTGRVIRDVNADILAVVEAENRLVLKLFSDQVLARVNGQPYEQVMVIDGNDMRGIDVGVMTRNGAAIDLMRSHIHDLKADGEPIFSRDCPEYRIVTAGGNALWVLPNHFKSKYGGNDPASRAKRTAQSARAAAIYEALIAAGEANVVILGDLNDTPDAGELAPLLQDTDLRDVSEHASFTAPAFNPAAHPGKGTFGLGNDGDKIDYLLLSPALFARVTDSGLFRKGAWPGSRPQRWEVYPELTRKVHVASDHHVIWVDLDLD